MHDIRNRKFQNEIEILPENIDMNKNNTNEKPKISFQDKQSICVLTFLYILQGIPLGLAGSVPLILQSKKVSYSTQATFSFVFWPFSLKILWAPIVDSIYCRWFGRRKSWLVPAQYLIGLTMIYVSYNARNWLGDGLNSDGSNGIDIGKLTVAFCLLNLLAATQDIAVDGWALTMLSKHSVGWASTCNSVGQTVGYCIAFIVFLALESADFCNNWLRAVPATEGLVTFEGFLHFWGVVFVVATTLVMLFKSEGRDDTSSDDGNIGGGGHGDNPSISVKVQQQYDEEEDEGQIQMRTVITTATMTTAITTTTNATATGEFHHEASLGLMDTYETLWRIIRLRPIYIYVLSLMMIKIGYSAADSLTGLKLIEKGVSKEKMAFIGSLIVPVQILLAIAVSKHTTGDAPLNVFIKASLPRMLYGPIFCLLVYFTPLFQHSDGSYSYIYYIVLTLIYSSHQIFVYPMFVSQMAFYARISDPAVGGTYMTLLNTVTNLASNIPSTIMLYLVDHITVKQCVGGPNNGLSCSSKPDELACVKSVPAGVCHTTIDGYYLEVIGCTCIGILALLSRRYFLAQVQRLPLDSWRVYKK